MMAGYMYTSSAFSVRDKWSLSVFSVVVWISVTLFSVSRSSSVCQCPVLLTGALWEGSHKDSVCLCCSQTVFTGSLHCRHREVRPWQCCGNSFRDHWNVQYLLPHISCTLTDSCGMNSLWYTTMSPVEHRGRNCSENSMRKFIKHNAIEHVRIVL